MVPSVALQREKSGFARRATETTIATALISNGLLFKDGKYAEM
jgi:hypothetical protein